MHSNGLVCHRKGFRPVCQYAIYECGSINGASGCKCRQKFLVENIFEGISVTADFGGDPRVIERDDLRLCRHF